MLDSLVLADGPIKNDAFPCIIGRSLKCCCAETHRLGGDQNPLRIEAVQDVLESVTFFADTICDRYFQVVDKDLVRVNCFASHLRDLMRSNKGAVEIRIKQAETLRWLFCLLNG